MTLIGFIVFTIHFVKCFSDEGDVSSNSEEELVEVNTITGETIWNGVTATREGLLQHIL